jgi:predicted nucleotide-binding protein
MAKRKGGNDEPVVPPSVTPEQGIDLLSRQRQKGALLLEKRPLTKADYQAWETVTRNFLVKAFGSTSSNVSSVMHVGKYGSFPMNEGESYWENHRAESLQRQLTIIDGLIELLETEAELTAGSASSVVQGPRGDTVFLVHGHDEAILQAAARFLERLKLPLVILREQPSKGRTIIEKFVDHSDVGFAVVLLTPDDRGGAFDAAYDKQRPRARQNVLLELGFFLGKLGRQHVCALYRQGVEIPSDYSGVVFVEFDDAGAWRLELAREMKAAGLQIDMNRAV